MPGPSAPSTPLILLPEEADAGSRLDAFLAARLAVPRAEARRLLQHGAVRLDGRDPGLSGKGWRLARAARVEVTGFTRPEERRAASGPDTPLVVLAEGPGWIAVDKPAGSPVHPLREGEGGTLLGAVLARHPQVQGVGEGGLRSGVVHRLDVDTSGAVLFATEEAKWRQLRQALRTRRVRKLYRTIVVGRAPREGRSDLWLRVARHSPARVRVVEPGREETTDGSRRASLSWRTLEQLGQASLLEVSLETGFLHQIRVSLAHLGLPVAGDLLYGAPVDVAAAPRQMLHAARIEYREIDAVSPDPPDFAALLERLRASA